ncbi:phosphotransferase [Kribbella sp. NPDC051952]|uniref:phosphotransferase family protein n=1 Tax=Kribbella sp. NPDC051952 TaxID=3154851 RepID=UPI0034399F47
MQVSQHQLAFVESENPWRPTEVVAEINLSVDLGLKLVGLDDLVGGTSGAAYVRSSDGREFALTRTKTEVKLMRLTAEILELAKSHGVPVPSHEVVLELSDGYVAVVQERLPGRRPTSVNAERVDAMVAMNERFADLLLDRPDVPPPVAFPSGDAYLDTLGSYSARSRRLLGELAALSPGEMASDDLVHTDYTLGNILYDDNGDISAVVDWNRGVARGDRRFALIGTRHNLPEEAALYGVLPEAITRLDEIIRATIDPDLLKIFSSLWAAHNLHTSIKNNFTADRIEHDLQYVEAIVYE